jgi:hypothetical protein
MCLKIRCDGKSEKFCKIFWELNRPLVISISAQDRGISYAFLVRTEATPTSHVHTSFLSAVFSTVFRPINWFLAQLIQIKKKTQAIMYCTASHKSPSWNFRPIKRIIFFFSFISSIFPFSFIFFVSVNFLFFSFPL